MSSAQPPPRCPWSERYDQPARDAAPPRVRRGDHHANDTRRLEGEHHPPG
eukprot:CAMPEP_0205891830 /NCGR_PEP_ID=MMETSP1083-20121108/22316_1 /ASSEMBLY_ACC=CAM_ASM_000430 /TAXON_ID=97485 /ORGANISM="Prymnesium parvum, Strain Texoma1" /LENGTH=49 /DNA_ID= /DNA_START= /DNA_END= /DNA_ORIENTATION=